MLNRSRAAALLEQFAKVRVLVVGDLMLDRYVFGEVTRISPEAPVPVVKVSREESRPGGASNVALNITALGGNSLLAGGVGKDAAARDLLAVLKRSGISIDGVVAEAEVQTSVKTRVVAERQQVVRVDRESELDPAGALVKQLCASMAAQVAGVDAVIIEDYGKGVVCQPLVDTVLREAKRLGKRVGFDPKDNHRLNFSWLTLATPNYREACSAANLPESPLRGGHEDEQVLWDVGSALADRWGTEFLMVTLGAHGMYLRPRKGAAQVLPTVAREVFDVSGAGDTVIAVAMMALAAGATHTEAAILANHAAGVVVGKLGTATCGADELLASFDSELSS